MTFHTGKAEDCSTQIESAAQTRQRILGDIGQRKIIRVVRSGGTRTLAKPVSVPRLRVKAKRGRSSSSESRRINKRVRVNPPATYQARSVQVDFVEAAGLLSSVDPNPVVGVLKTSAYRETVPPGTLQRLPPIESQLHGEAQTSDMRGDEEGRPTERTYDDERYVRDRSSDYTPDSRAADDCECDCGEYP